MSEEIIKEFKKKTGITLTEIEEGALYYGTNLILYDNNPTFLPNNLTINGFLDLHNTNITSLPKNLTVKGDVFISGTKITKIPSDIKIEGFLDITYLPIKILPDNLHIGGDLYMEGTDITELPKGLYVGGNLNLGRTNVEKLSEGLTVKGCFVFNTKITSLPKNIYLGDYILEENSPISEEEAHRVIKTCITEYNKENNTYSSKNISLVTTNKESIDTDYEVHIFRLMKTLEVIPYKDGNQWCALYGKNLQEGISGFGDTPYNAVVDLISNFHKN